MMVLMNCQMIVLMESLQWSFCQGPKSQIFTYLSILFSSTEVLPNFLAPCSFIGVMSVTFYHINGVQSL